MEVAQVSASFFENNNNEQPFDGQSNTSFKGGPIRPSRRRRVSRIISLVPIFLPTNPRMLDREAIIELSSAKWNNITDCEVCLRKALLIWNVRKRATEMENEIFYLTDMLNDVNEEYSTYCAVERDVAENLEEYFGEINQNGEEENRNIINDDLSDQIEDAELRRILSEFNLPQLIPNDIKELKRLLDEDSDISEDEEHPAKKPKLVFQQL